LNVSAEQVEAGQAVYSKGTLAVYDWVVLGISNRFIWQCPTPGLVAHYNKHLSANHLDVGVGTGYFLDRCRFATATPRVALMDLNPEALAFTARRIARYRPETYRRNVLEPIVLNAARFDSVGVNYLLHCMPGSIESKAVVFDHLKTLMNPNAVLFGSTLLQGGVHRSALAQRLMAVYNKKGIFSNEQDDLDGLERALRSRFREVSVQVVGCGALFSGRV
jgi:2-polyprenyl-3-methyl-5-hydroxy-6-metoxy-1,4-benzoquinol methylase